MTHSNPACSPDSVLANIFPFPEIKNTLKGRRHQDTEYLKMNVTAKLYTLLLGTSDESFVQLLETREQFVVVKGDYFKGK